MLWWWKNNRKVVVVDCVVVYSFTIHKAVLKKKVESRVDMRSIFFVDGKIYRINKVVEEEET